MPRAGPVEGAADRRLGGRAGMAGGGGRQPGGSLFLSTRSTGTAYEVLGLGFFNRKMGAMMGLSRDVGLSRPGEGRIAERTGVGGTPRGERVQGRSVRRRGVCTDARTRGDAGGGARPPLRSVLPAALPCGLRLTNPLLGRARLPQFPGKGAPSRPRCHEAFSGQRVPPGGERRGREEEGSRKKGPSWSRPVSFLVLARSRIVFPRLPGALRPNPQNTPLRILHPGS